MFKIIQASADQKMASSKSLKSLKSKPKWTNQIAKMNVNWVNAIFFTDDSGSIRKRFTFNYAPLMHTYLSTCL